LAPCPVDGTSLSNTASAFSLTARLYRPTRPPIFRDDLRQGRGRFQIALIYGTGGVAFAVSRPTRRKHRISGGNPSFASGNVRTPRRLTVGGGIQYAVTNNWSIFAEYRYTNWGSIRENNFGLLPTGAFFNGNRQINQNQVQAGFDYKFDLYGPTPVVAKY
jgi:outer membrane immunogenic protein